MSLVRFRPEAPYADLAHLVERHLAKVEVAGSSPVIRSNKKDHPCDGLFHWSFYGAAPKARAPELCDSKRSLGYPCGIRVITFPRSSLRWFFFLSLLRGCAKGASPLRLPPRGSWRANARLKECSVQLWCAYPTATARNLSHFSCNSFCHPQRGLYRVIMLPRPSLLLFFFLFNEIVAKQR